jgi:dienelactone hydrolase
LPYLALTVALTSALGAQAPGDEWLKKPVDDRTFKTYLEFFTYERSLPFDARVVATEQHEGIKREHLSFQSTPGARVFAHLYHPPGGDVKGARSVIVLHGGGPAGKNGQGNIRISQQFARAGWAVLAIDMQYFGERLTDLLTTFTEQEKHDRLYNQQSVYLAWMAQTVKDVGRSYDYLVGERGAEAKRVVLFGFSRGAMPATIAAGGDRRLAALVLLNGGHFDALERAHAGAACPANYIGRVSPRPVLMLNGLFDTDMIKDTSVEPLYALAKQPKQILWSEAGHAAPSEANQAAMLRWMRENVK